MRTLLAVVACLWCGVPIKAQSQPPAQGEPPNPDAWRAWLAPLVEKHLGAALKHPGVGLSVAIQNGPQTIYLGFGQVLTLQGLQTPQPDTIYEIGSVTKTVTGVLLAESLRRHEVQLQDPITKHLPPGWKLSELAGPSHIPSPTLRDLATHRSGLPVQPTLLVLLAKELSNPYSSYTPALMETSLPMMPRQKPGKYEYSSLGAGLLGHGLVRASRAKNYESLVRERIAGPLELIDFSEGLDGEQKTRLARPHDDEGEPTKPWDFASLPGCGALRSSARDVLRFARAGLGDAPEPLRTSFREAMQPLEDAGGKTRIGYFWHITEATPKRPRLLWHNGGTGGYRSWMHVQPESSTAVVLLLNQGDVAAVDRLGLALAEAMPGWLKTPQP